LFSEVFASSFFAFLSSAWVFYSSFGLDDSCGFYTSSDFYSVFGLSDSIGFSAGFSLFAS